MTLPLGDDLPERVAKTLLQSEFGIFEHWTLGMEAALQRASADESDDEIRDRFQNVIHGKPFD